MKAECEGIERIAIEKDGKWHGIIREAYTRDCHISLASKKAAEEWINAVHDSCDCED
jgi:hypothetical protein